MVCGRNLSGPIDAKVPISGYIICGECLPKITKPQVSINELVKQVHEAAVKRGFYSPVLPLPTLLMLVVRELGECLEADRKDISVLKKAIESPWFSGSTDNIIERALNAENIKGIYEELIKDTVEGELTDAIMRLIDIAGYLGVDLEKHMEAAMRYNALRPTKHGKRY
jgi:NTP pyrophosphatase (non-canonical NTP hydrolase)